MPLMTEVLVPHSYKTLTISCGCLLLLWHWGSSSSFSSFRFMSQVKWNYVVVIIFANKHVIESVTWQHDMVVTYFSWRLTINWDFEHEATIWDPSTHVSIENLRNKKFAVFCASWAVRAVKRLWSTREHCQEMFFLHTGVQQYYS